MKLLCNRLLVDYAGKLNANSAHDKYSIHSSIFNAAINPEFSAGEKRKAVTALQAVISGDMPPSSLQPHIKVLENGELGNIFRAISGICPEIDLDVKPPKKARR